MAIYQLSSFLYRYYGKKVILLLDEYDIPMQEAYVNGYWEEFAGFIRSLFHASFKTNQLLMGKQLQALRCDVKAPGAGEGCNYYGIQGT